MNIINRKRFFSCVAVLLFLVVACAGVGVQLNDNATTILQNSATSTVGYLIVKNNPQFRDPIIQWYMLFREADDLMTVQTMFRDGIEKLAKSVSDDPYLSMQIANAMTLLEINFDGPQIELDIGRYQGIVDAFMMGVMAVPYTI